MTKEEFQIEIMKSGEVRVTFKDMSGSHVVEYVEILTRLIGKLNEDEIQLHAGKYKPDPKVGIISPDNTKIRNKL